METLPSFYVTLITSFACNGPTRMVDIIDDLDDNYLGEQDAAGLYSSCTMSNLLAFFTVVFESGIDADSVGLVCLTVSPNSPWNDFSPSEWTTFCECVQLALPRVETLWVRGALFLGDERLSELVLHLPATVTAAHMLDMLCDFPKTFLAIGQAFPNLRELDLRGWVNYTQEYGLKCCNRMLSRRSKSMITERSILALTHSMSLLRHSLELFFWGGIVSPDTERLVAPLVAFLRVTPTLKRVRMPHLKNISVQYEERRCTISISEADAACTEGFDFGPRIQAALEKAGRTPYFDMTSTQMVEAIIDVSDSADCLYYLFSQNPVFPQLG